jgi:ATP/maltotriose-dependent transcriptional regulator MalT/DNA-binding SARP family transcriptional activator
MRPPGAVDTTGAPGAGLLALARPRVDGLLAAAWRHRVTLVIAAGGFGKTTALRALASGGTVCSLGLRTVDREIEGLSARLADALHVAPVTGTAFPTAAIGAEDRRSLAEGQAAMLCESIGSRGEDVLLVIDDVDRLEDDDEAVHLLRALCLQAPPQLHITLSGRRLPPLGLGAATGTTAVLEIAAPDLAFTSEEAGLLIDARLGSGHDAIAEKCWALTGGWAAALHLIVDRLQRLTAAEWEPALERMPVLNGQLWREFVADLFDQESPETRRIIEIATATAIVDPELLAALGVTRPATALGGLQNRGLLVAADGSDGLRMSPVLSEVVSDLLAQDKVSVLRDEAASWLESADRLEEALECRRGGSPEELRGLMDRHGHTLVSRGGGARIAEILGRIGTGDVPKLDGVLGEALQAAGDWDGAMRTFSRLRRSSEDARLSPELAWRYGALLYLRGDSATALDVLRAAHVDGDGDGDVTADDALVSAWLSSTLWSRGEPRQAEQMAKIALSQAESDRDPGALAAAHVAAALAAASSGDRDGNERHYRAALRNAALAGDSIQLARIHANLSSRAIEEGNYRAAIEESDRALSVGAGHKFFAALAMCNRAEALLRLGELDDARAALAESIDTYEALGSLVACAPNTLLGMVYLERGDLTRARVSFERGLKLAERGDDAHTLVYALCGLAQTVAEDDPDAAREYVQQAIERASSLERAHAYCAAASVELRAGSRVAAATLARKAESEARGTADRPSLAEALALQAIAADPPNEDRLRAALDIWTELGNVISQLRAKLLVATWTADQAAADHLRTELAHRGVLPTLGSTDAPGLPAQGLTITTLGRFGVMRAGERVAAGAWQSRKARDLLKLLAGRLGRPITRDAAAEALWPNEPPGPLSNRLSVALSTLRRVLDPERSHPPDHFIASDAQSLALRIETVTVDVVAFLQKASDAISKAADGDWASAEVELREAEKLYVGDFLEEDLYEDWTVDCREAARSTAVDVSRLLARAGSERDDDETASRHLRRLLERDPYDEDAWIALVGAQSRLRRYGEARRQHAVYARRMAELGVAPVSLAQTMDIRP